MQIVYCLRVNIKFSPLSKMFISQARQLFYRTIKSCEHHFYASQSIYTQNFKEYSFVVTDLLMARTRLRLGENLACVVYLHRWNYHKHLVFYSVVMQSINFFFFNTRNNLKNKKEKRDRDWFHGITQIARDSNKQLFTLFYSQKKRYSIKTKFENKFIQNKKKNLRFTILKKNQV